MPNTIGIEVPLLEELRGNVATFKDGSTKAIDAIILCTGYLHHFPFMSDDLKLRTANRLATANLYKGVQFIDNPKLFYIGMQDQWFTFNMFDAQAWWARDVIMGKIDVPQDKSVMLADVQDRVAREEPPRALRARTGGMGRGRAECVRAA